MFQNSKTFWACVGVMWLLLAGPWPASAESPANLIFAVPDNGTFSNPNTLKELETSLGKRVRNGTATHQQEVYYLLVLDAQGKGEDVWSKLDTLLSRCPPAEMAELSYLVGSYLGKAKRYDRAKPYLIIASSIARYNADMLDTLLLLAIRMNDEELVKYCFKRVEEVEPSRLSKSRLVGDRFEKLQGQQSPGED